MPATEYRFSFGIMTGGRVLLPERRRSFKDFVLEENCLCVPAFMCVFIYKPHGRISLPLNIWKLHRTHNMFQYASCTFPGIHTWHCYKKFYNLSFYLWVKLLRRRAIHIPLAALAKALFLCYVVHIPSYKIVAQQIA